MDIWQHLRTNHTYKSYNKEKYKKFKRSHKQNKNKNTIYKIDIFGLIYIGQTNNLKARMKEHKENAFKETCTSYNIKLSKAIRKYGILSLKIAVLHNKIPFEEMDKLEILEIKNYDSFNNGLNGTSGGRYRIT